MATFWTWAFRNPSLLIGGLMLAAGATAVLEWGLALTAFSAAAITAHMANHLAHKSRERSEIKEAIAQADVLRLNARKRRSSHLDFVDGGEAPYEHAA